MGRGGFLKLPDRKDFLDYAEGASLQDTQMQRQILNLLASSSVMREQLVELKKDLYLVSSQVPDYVPEAQFGAEVAKLAQTWLQVVYNRKFSMKNFHRSREFFGIISFVVGATLVLLVLLGLRTLL